MTPPEYVVHPGDLLFLSSPARIKTLLGSCVAVTFWSRETQEGGLCHYLLDQPQKEGKPGPVNRYGCFALENLLSCLGDGQKMSGLDVGLFGGGNLFSSNQSPTIGERNVLFARQWLESKGLVAKHEDVLGNFCRTLILDLSDGCLEVKHYSQDFEGGHDEH